MDNLTHSIAGMLAAEAALQWRAGSTPPAARVRSAAYLGSVFANNVPDFDFVYTWITPGPLGYLLHHRGHTHTLGLALLLGAATLLACGWFVRRGAGRPSRTDWLRIAALCCIGPWIHIGMDYSNSYGVHPLWPVSSRWFYGDSVFIVEPWFWVAAVPPLIFAAQRRLTRVGLALVLLGGLGLAWTIDSVPWGAALALSLGALISGYVARQRSARGRVVQALTGCAAMLLALLVSSRMANARLRADAGKLDGLGIQDIILTPQPANPLCFAAIVVGTRGDAYVMRTAQLSSIPSLLPGERCRLQPSEPTAPLKPLPAAASRDGSVRWLAEFTAPLAELRRLNDQHCELAAFLRFARAPYWLPAQDGRRIVGDLRYDRAPELDFADLALRDQPARCPPHVPPWQPPRSDVLGTP